MPGTSFFSWPRTHVRDFLKELKGPIVFIPFAAVTLSFDSYEDAVARAFAEMGYDLKSVHKEEDKKAMIGQAAAIVTGGGNTFALLKRMYDEDLLGSVRAKVAAGTPYIGWSAGANLACPTLRTTNDMPIVMPPSFDALNLVPFQINPHYHELKFENQGGETRRERLQEFLMLNPESKVIGLPEGMFIRREGAEIKIGGTGTARLYANNEISDLLPNTNISFLL